MSWTEPYIGIPYKPHGRGLDGWDCYGLVRHVLSEHSGDQVPDYVYDESNTMSELAAMFDANLYLWQEIPESLAAEFDVVLLEIAGCASHCGVYLGKGKMLHCLEGCETSIIRVRSHIWKPKGFYRWVGP